MNIRTRVAPSPTGFPHVGTAYQALFDWVWAKKHQGKFILRIEDTDQERTVIGAEEVIFNSLAWLGLLPDEDPKEGGEFGPYRQSERLPLYKKYAEDLVEKGFAYYCFCPEEKLAVARKDQAEKHLAPKYNRCCRSLPSSEAERRIAAGERACIRMKIPDNERVVVADLIRGQVEFDSNTLDDQVILKSDGFPTYHLAVVVDDHLMQISHTIRGEEWLPSAPKHVLLYRYMNWEPPVFVHLPTLRNPDHSKLSKRQGHTSIFWYRDQGFLPEALLNYLASIVWNHLEGKEIFDLPDLIKYFDFKDMSCAAPVFDLTKCEWMNGEYLRKLTAEEFAKKAIDFWKIVKEKANFSDEELLKIAPLIQERIKKLSEVKPMISYFKEAPKSESLKEGFSEPSKSAEFLDEAAKVFVKTDPWQTSEIHETVQETILQTGYKKGDFCMALRIAITGSKVSPPLFESMEILGKDESLKRIEAAEKLL